MSTHHTPGDLQVKIKLPAGLIETRTHDGDDTIVEIEPLDDREASRQAVEKALEELRGNELVIEVPEHSRFGFRGWRRAGASHRRRPEGRAHQYAHGVRRRPAARGAGVDRRRQRLRRTVRRTGRRQRRLQDGIGRSLGRRHRPQRQTEHRLGRRPRRVDRRPGIGEARLGRRRDRSGRRRRPRRARSPATPPLRAVSRGETSVKSVSGDIKVGVVAGTKVWLDVNSMSGDTTSDLDPSEAPATKNGESLRVKASSTSGDVRITRAASAAPAG